MIAAAFTSSIRSTIRPSAENELAIKDLNTTGIGRMEVIAVNDTMIASNKSANGRLTLMRVCTMMTKVH